MRANPRVLASTTSHKAEPLLPTLEVFSRLGLLDVDLNLHHVLEAGVPVAAIQQQAGAVGLRIRALSGGWCDFFQAPPKVDETFRSIDRQVAIADQLATDVLRLFFGRLKREDYSAEARETICANLRALSGRHPSMRFVFENHDGASLDPQVCRDVLASVDRPNVRMNFDPINFERAGVDSLQAVRLLAPLVGHVHLKGLEGGEFCEFGVGDVDLSPVLDELRAAGFSAAYSVEYEGRFDKTLRLYESVKRARLVVDEIRRA
jgi:sugar phosphate isomerase/epimerase